MVSEAKYEVTNGKGLKILTFKQMLQRLIIALAQIKAGNTSESLKRLGKMFILYIKQTKLLKSTKKYN